MSIESNPWDTIIGRPRGLTHGSMGGNGAMGGGTPPPLKGSMVLVSPSLLVPLVFTIFSCLILYIRLFNFFFTQSGRKIFFL